MLLPALQPGPAWPVPLSTGLLIGLIAVAAVIGGNLARLLRVPSVLGYIGAGVALRPLAQALNGSEGGGGAGVAAEASLDAIVSLGLGLILFTIGGVFEARAFKRARGHLWRLATAEIGLTFVLVFVFVWGALSISGAGETDWTGIMAFALLLACGAIATAPAATIFVLREYQAKGRMSEAIMGMVGVNNALAITLFQVAFVVLAAAGAIETSELTGRAIWLEMAYAVFGSVLAGTIVGLVMAILHARLRAGDSFLVLGGLTLLLDAGAQWLAATQGYADILLLSMLVAGAVFSNAAVDSERLNETVRTLAAPVFVGFFVVAGYRLHLADLPRLGLVGSAYIGARTLGKIGGAWLGARWARPRAQLPEFLGAGMLCQAAVIIGLAEFVRTTWHHEWLSQTFVTTVFGSVIVFELMGPLLLKAVVVRAGEVKLETILRRSPASTPVSTATRVAVGSLARAVGIGGTPRQRRSGPLQVRHVMRTNVETLPAWAQFGEVLGFVEKSQLSDFPVVDEGGELIGVIHFNELRRVVYDPALRTLVTAADLVASDTDAIEVDAPLDRALAAFRDCDARALPVSDKAGSKRIIGVVEERDVLRALHLRPEGQVDG